jgi:hypothetical protein
MRTASVGVAAALVLAACGDTAGGTEQNRAAGVYSAVISAVVAEETAPPTTDDALPVVFVVPSGPETISAAVQADVVKDLKDDADVRFADDREEAIDDSAAELPVHDDGTLLSVAVVPERGNRVDLEVEVYRSLADQQSMVFSLQRRGDGWAVTSMTPAG